MKKSGSKGGQGERRKQARLAKTKAKRKTKNGKATLFVVPDAPDLPELPDRRAMEGVMANMFGRGSHGSGGVDDAQQLMYDAWESDNPKERVALAREALKVSADCADAYNLLAEEAARDLGEAVQLYREGVEAGERALGPGAFEEDVGHFWGILETRPYMRARAGLAQTLWTLGKKDEAVEHYQEMLRLNPNDNQGLRYVLAACLLDLGRDEDTAALLEQYDGDCAAAWAYAAALLAFRAEGDTSRSKGKLAEAVKANAFTPAYLTGAKKMPRHLPDYIGIGDDNEAVSVASDYASAWHSTPGALEWLRANSGQTVGASAGPRRGRGRSPARARE